MSKQLEALIAEMKAAAEKVTQGAWVAEGESVFTDTGEEICMCATPDPAADRPNAVFIALMGPTNTLALISALEQAQQDTEEANARNDVKCSQLCKQDEGIAMLKQRIAELEASLPATTSVARAALDYIDALPADVVAGLPAMPGFDRDWADEVLSGTAGPLAVKLHKRSVGEVMHMSGFSRDYAEGWCAGNDNAIHEIRAAGGTVSEGE